MQKNETAGHYKVQTLGDQTYNSYNRLYPPIMRYIDFDFIAFYSIYNFYLKKYTIPFTIGNKEDIFYWKYRARVWHRVTQCVLCAYKFVLQ